MGGEREHGKIEIQRKRDRGITKEITAYVGRKAFLTLALCFIELLQDWALALVLKSPWATQG